MTERILILDFGSQFTQLIARRIRESGVYCEILPFNTAPQRIADFGAKGIILSGGPASVYEGESPKAPPIVFEMDVPVLGICYGEQAICDRLGGKVEHSDHRERQPSHAHRSESNRPPFRRGGCSMRHASSSSRSFPTPCRW